MSRFENARGLLQDFKGDTYIAGVGVLPKWEVQPPDLDLGRCSSVTSSLVRKSIQR